jgi:hypothetical protein
MRRVLALRYPECRGMIAVALCAIVWTAPALAYDATLTFLTVNDVYEITPVRGRGGLAELLTLLKAERATASYHLTTVNGDFLSPSLMSALLQGAQMIDLFNALGVDVVVFGNHEFDFGAEVTRQRIAASQFPWLGTNVRGPGRATIWWGGGHPGTPHGTCQNRPVRGTHPRDDAPFQPRPGGNVYARGASSPGGGGSAAASWGGGDHCTHPSVHA